MTTVRSSLRFLFFFVFACCAAGARGQLRPRTVNHVRITILSTMLAQDGIGEWGFSALVEADSVRILFDAGGRPGTVLQNAKELGIDLSTVPTLLLSHWHEDHTAGWLPLRKAVAAVNGGALATTHVGAGFFSRRLSDKDHDTLSKLPDSAAYARTGGQVLQHSRFTELSTGIYVTGNVPRIYPERNVSPGMKRWNAGGGLEEDDVPDDLSLVIATPKGLVLLSGCGHSGLINTLAHVQKNLPGRPLLATIGGFHLLNNNDAGLKWTAGKLKGTGVRYFMGAHCTGVEAVYQIRNYTGLKRGDCIVGSVGDQFDSNKGFLTGPLNR